MTNSNVKNVRGFCYRMFEFFSDLELSASNFRFLFGSKNPTTNDDFFNLLRPFVKFK